MPASSQITIRSVSGELRSALLKEAERRGQSLNKTVLALLSERLGLSHGGASIVHDELDELAGTWSKSEADRFDEAVEAQRPIDPKLWK